MLPAGLRNNTDGVKRAGRRAKSEQREAGGGCQSSAGLAKQKTVLVRCIRKQGTRYDGTPCEYRRSRSWEPK